MISSLNFDLLEEGNPKIRVWDFDGNACVLPIKEKYTIEEKYLIRSIENYILQHDDLIKFILTDYPVVLDDLNYIMYNLEKRNLLFQFLMDYYFIEETEFIINKESFSQSFNPISIKNFYNMRYRNNLKSIILINNKWILRENNNKVHIISYNDSKKIQTNKLAHEIFMYVSETIPFYRNSYSYSSNYINYDIIRAADANAIKKFINGLELDLTYKIYLESFWLHKNISFKDFLKKCLNTTEVGQKYRQSVATKWINLHKKMEEYLTNLSDEHSDILVDAEDLNSEDVHGGDECAQDIEDAPKREEASSEDGNDGEQNSDGEGQDSSSNGKEGEQNSDGEGQDSSSNGKEGEQNSDGEGQDFLMKELEKAIFGGGHIMNETESIIIVKKQLKKLFEKLSLERSPYGRENGREFWDSKKLVKAKINPEFFKESRGKSEKEKEHNIYMFLDNSGSMDHLCGLFKGMLQYSSKFVNVFTGSEAHPCDGENYKKEYEHSFYIQMKEWIKEVKPAYGSILIFWGDTCDLNIYKDEQKIKKLLSNFKCYWLGVYENNSYKGWEQPKLKKAGFNVIAPVTNPLELESAIKKIRV